MLDKWPRRWQPKRLTDSEVHVIATEIKAYVLIQSSKNS